MVTRKRLSIMLQVHCAPCCLYIFSTYVMHQQFNIQQLYSLPTLYLCALSLSENKQRLAPLQSETDWIL